MKYFHDQERRADLSFATFMPERSGGEANFPSCLAKAGEEITVQRRGVRLKTRRILMSEATLGSNKK